MLFKDKEAATEQAGQEPARPVAIEVPTSRN